MASTTQAQEESPIVEPRWLFPVIDVTLMLLSFALAYLLRYELQLISPVLDPSRREFTPYIPFALIYAGLLVFNYQNAGLYKNIRGRALMEEFSIIANGVTNAIVIILALFFVLQPLVTSRLMLVYVAVLTVLLLAIARVIRRWVLSYLRGKGIGVQRVVIVGMGEVGQAVLSAMIARPELGFKPIGYVDDNPEMAHAGLGRIKGLGGLDSLEATIQAYRIELVVITLSWENRDQILKLVEICRRAGTEIRVVPDVFQLNLRQVNVENLNGIPLLGLHSDRDFRGVNRLLKRSMDIGLILLASPLLLMIAGLVALAIRIEGPGPILYRQRRVGENGRRFDMYKFRSMIPDADKYHAQIVANAGEDPRHPKIKDDPRITRVGKFLRRTSLDELPNLRNVLSGQMSLVGPRPPTPDEVALYKPWHKQRLKIIPGITGLWQVSGRSDVPFEEMCLLDIYYIENWSVKLDVQILLMTVPRVLLRRGAY